MNRFPAIDLAGTLRLTLQGRRKDAIATLRGKRASAPLSPLINRYAKPTEPGVIELLDPPPFLKGPFQPVQDKRPQPPPDGARFEERSYSNAAGTRKYNLFVPSGYIGQVIPLVVMLHGCKQLLDDFAAETRMNSRADEHRFLVAYPEPPHASNISKCWNWFNAVNQRRGSGEAASPAAHAHRARRAALGLHQWTTAPDFDREGEVDVALANLSATPLPETPLLAAALGCWEWFENGGTRPPLRALVPLTGPRYGGIAEVSRATALRPAQSVGV